MYFARTAAQRWMVNRMDDLISRQAAIDALRYAQHRFTVADEAGGMGTVKWSEDVIYFAAAERVLSELPSAQPEITRCKDCEHWTNDDCPFAWGKVEDAFCSYAERRTDE